MNPDYEKIAMRVADTDATYRWLRELVLIELEKIRERDSGFVGSAALNLRDRFSFMRHVNLENETYERMKFWLKSMSGASEFNNSDNDMNLRMDALKIGLLESSFVYFDDPKSVQNLFKHYITELSYSDVVQEAVEQKSDSHLATQTKIILDASDDVVLL